MATYSTKASQADKASSDGRLPGESSVSSCGGKDIISRDVPDRPNVETIPFFNEPEYVTWMKLGIVDR